MATKPNNPVKSPAANPVQSPKASVSPKKVNKPRPKASGLQLELAEDQLFTLRLGSIDVPVVKDGRGTFITKRQDQWTLKDQRALLAYWAVMKEENPKFDIEAKKAKLFIMPASAPAEAKEDEETADDELASALNDNVQVNDDDDDIQLPG
jgi:hypothetical protein